MDIEKGPMEHDIWFWDSNDIAAQGAWSYVSVLEYALEVAVECLVAAGASHAVEKINATLDETNEHRYTPEYKHE